MITPAQSSSREIEHFYGFEVQHWSTIITIGNAHILPGLIRVNGYDIIHLHYPFFGGECSGLAAWIGRIPLVITYHHDVILRGWKSVVERCLRASIERWLIRSARFILFTSQDYANSSCIRPHLNGCEERISILPNGIDITQFFPSQDSKQLGKFFGFNSSDLIVLLVANLDRAHYFKGVEVLLNALAQLPRWVKGIIVGEGDMRSQYESKARKLKIESRVVFAGRVTDTTLREFYQLADVTILPSTTRGEAFGLVLLESLACGTPVIASNLPGVKTVVVDGKDGYLVKPGDVDDLTGKISFLLENRERIWEMGMWGRAKIVERYSWGKIIRKLEAIYIESLNGI